MTTPVKRERRDGGLRSLVVGRQKKQSLGRNSPSNLAAAAATSGRFPTMTPTKESSETANVTSSSTKGLRMMSIKICEKVQKSGKTTCTEVAEELIQLIKKEQEAQGSGKTCDEKNVRRRTYDALNVLEAVNVIAKDSKDITWKGTPRETHNEARRLIAESDNCKKRIREKQEAIREQLTQQAAYRNLVLFNKRRDRNPLHKCDTNRIGVPLIVFSANTNAVVHCDASRDMSHVMMDVNAPFAIHDENSLLRQMGLDQTTLANLKELVPEDMLDYCQKHGLLDGLLPRKRVHDAKPSAPATTLSTRKKHTGVQSRVKRVKSTKKDAR